METLNFDELYYLVKEKNEDAEAILCQEIEKYLKFLSYTKVNSFLRAEDIMSFGWQGYIEALDAYRPDTTVNFYVFTKNCINRRLVDIQRKRNKQSLKGLMMGMSIEESKVAYIVDMKNHTSVEDIRLLFRQFLQQLSLTEQQIFQLYLEKDSVTEVSLILKKKEQFIYKTIREIKDKLKKMYRGD